MPHPAPQTVLIIGSHGRFGSHAAEAFRDAGWHTRLYNRAHNNLLTAATGVDVIVMAGNPGGYDVWERDLLPMHDQVIAVAKQTGSTVIVPGNVYVFGPDAPSPWTAETPHLARNPLGRLRDEMEDRYRASGVQTIILRCGDFLNTHADGNWFDRFIAPHARHGHISYPGPFDCPHAWAYLPDATRAAVALAQKRSELGQFEDIPFPGYTLTGAELAAAVGKALGQPEEAKSMSWATLAFIRPFVPVVKGLFELRYLWSLPQRLDPQKFNRLVPDFRPTPVPEAVGSALSFLPETA